MDLFYRGAIFRHFYQDRRVNSNIGSASRGMLIASEGGRLVGTQVSAPG